MTHCCTFYDLRRLESGVRLSLVSEVIVEAFSKVFVYFRKQLQWQYIAVTKKLPNVIDLKTAIFFF